MVVVTSIGGFECSDIRLSRLGWIDQIDPAPYEAWLAELNSEQISYQARETPVAVRIGTNSHNAVDEPHRDFVGRERGVLDPIFGVVDHLMQVDRERTLKYEQKSGSCL